jgi:hypothetical protein
LPVLSNALISAAQQPDRRQPPDASVCRLHLSHSGAIPKSDRQRETVVTTVINSVIHSVISSFIKTDRRNS